MTNVKMLIADYPEDVKRLLREAGIIDTSLALARTDEVKPPIALPLPTSGSPVPSMGDAWLAFHALVNEKLPQNSREAVIRAAAPFWNHAGQRQPGDLLTAWRSLNQIVDELPDMDDTTKKQLKDAFSEVANRVLEKYITHIATTPFTNQPVDPPVS